MYVRDERESTASADDVPAATQQLLRSQELGEHHPGCRRNRASLAGREWLLGYARLKEIWAAHSTCSTRRSGSM